MSLIQVACPGCQKTLRLSQSVCGKTIRCPACQTAFAVGVVSSPDTSRTRTGRKQRAPSSTDPSTNASTKSRSTDRPRRRTRHANPAADDRVKSREAGQRQRTNSRRRKPEPEVAVYADPWDDELDDDFEEMDEFAAPVRSKSNKKSRRKKSKRRSGFPKILLALLFGFIGVGAVGGLGYGIYKIAPLLTGGNVVSLQYFPENLGGFVHYRVADAINTPLAQDLMATAGASPLDNFKVQGLPEATQIQSITMGMNKVDLSSGFNRMRNSSVRDGLIVARLSTPFDPAASPGSNGDDYGGQKIYQRGLLTIWCPDATTIVAGPRNDVTEAIDRGGKEFRFRHFDFADVSHHVSVVVAENATRGSDKHLSQSSGVPAFDSLAASANKNLQGVCIGLSLSTGVDIDLQVRCYGNSEATALKSDIDAGITQLKQQLSSNPMMAPFATLANELIDGLQTTQSGRSIDVSLTITSSMIDRVKQMAGASMR